MNPQTVSAPRNTCRHPLRPSSTSGTQPPPPDVRGDNRGKKADLSVLGLIGRCNAGDAWALGQLISVHYRQLCTMARSALRKKADDCAMEPAELVSELYEHLRKHNTKHFENIDHFFAVAALKFGQILSCQYEKLSAQKRDHHKTQSLCFTDAYQAEPSCIEQLVHMDALNQIRMTDRSNVKLAELKIFWGFENAELARLFSVSEASISRRWRVIKAQIKRKLTR